MELDFAFLADAADVSMGKLFVLGGAFDTIHVPGFPASHPALAVVIRLLLSPNDLDRKHKLEVLLLDADAHHIASANGELMVPKAPGISRRLEASRHPASALPQRPLQRNGSLLV